MCRHLLEKHSQFYLLTKAQGFCEIWNGLHIVFTFCPLFFLSHFLWNVRRHAVDRPWHSASLQCGSFWHVLEDIFSQSIFRSMNENEWIRRSCVRVYVRQAQTVATDDSVDQMYRFERTTIYFSTLFTFVGRFSLRHLFISDNRH